MDGPLDALAAAQRYFIERLRHAPSAIEYLKKRGVSGDIAKRFCIGYAPEGWDGLTQFLTDTRHALDAGLLIDRGDREVAYDRLRTRVMFTIRGTRGRGIGLGGITTANAPTQYRKCP